MSFGIPALAKQINTEPKKRYLGDMEFVGNSLEAMYHPCGQVLKEGNTNEWRWTVNDHLGNRRILMSDDNTIISESHYYTFGMEMLGKWNRNSTDPTNDYLYNGKEINDEMGLGWYDYGARFFDSAIGWFVQIEPGAELYSGWSLYHYVYNNPLKYVDPTGAFIDYKDQKGNTYGTDGNDDGRIVVVSDKKEVKRIKRTNKSGGTISLSDVNSGVELPSEFVRSEMSKAVDGACSPSFHEEGGYFGTTSGDEEFVVHAKSGDPADPLVDETASINVRRANNIADLPNDANPTINGEFHTHPDGVVTRGNRTGHFENTPSNRMGADGVRYGDIPNAASSPEVKGNSFVLAQGNKTVYIYNGTGTLAKVPFKAFFPKK